MKIILASKSPRRRELLEMLGFKDFEIIPASGPELSPEGLTPSDTVCGIALGKAREVAKNAEKGALIIAADTLVCLDGEFLGKPKDKEDAARMLERLSGRTHTVYTGVALIKDGEELCEAEASDVLFRELSGAEIDAYIATGEPMDKAGAYGAQGLGALLVKGIDGDFFNVMGLPVCTLGLMLGRLGVDVLKQN